MAKRPKRPRDMNQLGKMIVDLATGNVEPEVEPKRSAESEAAALLGRKGGLRGGKARAAKLSAKRRTEIARNAVNARWQKKKSNN